jgi:S1-C subfamily serine protease
MALRPLLLIALYASGCTRLSEHQRASTPPYRLAPRQVAPADCAVAFSILTINFDTYQRGDASGCFVAPDGLAVTCAHVFASGHAERLKALLPDGTRSEFEVVAVDALHDLALIRVDGLNVASAFIPVSPRDPVPDEPLWTVTKAGVRPTSEGSLSTPRSVKRLRR